MSGIFSHSSAAVSDTVLLLLRLACDTYGQGTYPVGMTDVLNQPLTQILGLRWWTFSDLGYSTYSRPAEPEHNWASYQSCFVGQASWKCFQLAQQLTARNILHPGQQSGWSVRHPSGISSLFFSGASGSQAHCSVV